MECLKPMPKNVPEAKKKEEEPIAFSSPHFSRRPAQGGLPDRLGNAQRSFFLWRQEDRGVKRGEQA